MEDAETLTMEGLTVILLSKFRKIPCKQVMVTGGGGGIRTLDGVTPITIFETVPFNRSGTPPQGHIINKYSRNDKQ